MRNEITDIEGLLVGQAGDARLKSGVTVLTADRPFTAAVQVMGGAPGTRETDLLDPDRTVQQVDALVLSGGSAFGLDAAGGVADALRRDGRGFRAGPVRVPIVPGAILFDLVNGGDKDWTRNPYRELGEAAYAARGPGVAIGSHGAGTGALVAGLKGGLGTASARLESGHVVGALVAVNAMGAANVGGTRHFWAAPWERDGEFGGLGLPATFPDPMAPVTKAGLMARAGETGDIPLPPGSAGSNTTIGIVATDAVLDQAQARRVATAAHDGFARALVPSHGPSDGDLVFAAATGGRPNGPGGAEALLGPLCHAAAVVMARAIARGIHAATPAPGDPFPCWSEL